MRKKTITQVPLPGSTKLAPAAGRTDDVNAGDIIQVTIRLRRRNPIEPALQSGKIYTWQQYTQQFGADTRDITKIEKFAFDNHLTVVESDIAKRNIIVRGKIADFEKAFQVHLANYHPAAGQSFRGRAGHIYVPQELSQVITGVFGLDNRPQARPACTPATRVGAPANHANTPAGVRPADTSLSSLTPLQVAEAYGFPPNYTGKGQCIGIIELGGGYRTTDLENYFSGLGLTPPAISTISADKVSVNSPSTADSSSDQEVMLDIEIAGAVAPEARLVIYFSAADDQGFLNAINTAVHDNVNQPSVISISWVETESPELWTEQSIEAFNEDLQSAVVLGITVCVATGDHGSGGNLTDGKVHVCFPSTNPYVLACGGTRLELNGTRIAAESVWNASNGASGGGISEHFTLPDYQQHANVSTSLSTGFAGRGVPDIAGNADPATGYPITVDGQTIVIGGTSAVAPLMAALIARLNQKNGGRMGFINPRLYSNPASCRDITQGNNITDPPSIGYQASAGWDACTGLGVFAGSF